MKNELPKEGLLSWAAADIVPSPFQERRDFAEGPLHELADSIRQHAAVMQTANGELTTGIIQPMTVRRVGEGPLELVCGERRLRAAKLAGQELVPVFLRILSDTDAENIVLTENVQREDLKPSEEARTYDRMLKLRAADGSLMHTREGVAKIASKTLNHIDDCLKLLLCPPLLLAAVDEGKARAEGYVSLAAAMVIGRIPDPKLRPAAAEKMLWPSYQQTPMNYAQTKELVRKEFMVSLATVPWDMADTALVPVKHAEEEGVQVRCFGGACESCPFLSANIGGAVISSPDIRSRGDKTISRKTTGTATNLCTLPKCHAAKLDAVCKQQRRNALERGLKVLDDAEGKKQFHPSRNETANGAKYVWLDEKLQYHQVGSLSYHTDRKWRALLAGSGVPVVLARNPHTGLLVEMAIFKEAKPVGEKAARAKKPTPAQQAEKSPAEIKAEEDAKKRRTAEIRQEKIDAIALKETLHEIVRRIETKGASAEVLAEMFEIALGRSGADGIRFLTKHLEVPKPTGPHASSWDNETPIVKLVKARCEERVAAWQGMLALVLVSWEVAFNGLSAAGLKCLAKACGVKADDMQVRAKALFGAEEKGKKPASHKATKDKPGVKEEWSVEQVNSTVKAADERAKTRDCESGASKSGVADTKIGSAERWTPADVEAGAKLLKAKTHKMADLIGPPPVRKEVIKLKNYNAVRLRLMRKAGK